jgi:hypothetical protein
VEGHKKDESVRRRCDMMRQGVAIAFHFRASDQGLLALACPLLVSQSARTASDVCQTTSVKPSGFAFEGDPAMTDRSYQPVTS